MQVKMISSTDGSAVIAWAGDNGVERGVIPAELVKVRMVVQKLILLVFFRVASNAERLKVEDTVILPAAIAMMGMKESGIV